MIRCSTFQIACGLMALAFSVIFTEASYAWECGQDCPSSVLSGKLECLTYQKTCNVNPTAWWGDLEEAAQGLAETFDREIKSCFSGGCDPKDAFEELLNALSIGVAMDDNWKDVKRGKEDGWENVPGGDVVWGKLIGYNDYAKFIEAVSSTITDRDFEPLKRFFENSVESMMAELDESVQELGQAALQELLLAALLDEGEPIQEGRLEIDVGIAKIDYWWEVADQSIPYFPKYKPYIRYRVAELPAFPTAEIIQRVEAAINGQTPSQEEIERIITEKLLQTIEEQIAQIPRRDAEPVALPVVRQILTQYADVASMLADLPSIITQTVAQVRETIIASAPGYSGSLVFDWAKSNRPNVRSGIGGDGWLVIWGVNIDEVEYVKLGSAIAGSAVSGGAALAAYFQEYLYRTLEKVEQQAPDIGRDILEQIISQALTDRGKLFKVKNLEVQAGVATYNRWLEFPYIEITTSRDDWTIPGLNQTIPGFRLNPPIPKMFKSNLPNHHQPYIKLRFNNGTLPVPNGDPQGGDTKDRVYIARQDPAFGESIAAQKTQERNGDTIKYTVAVTNLLTDPVYVMIQDAFDAYVEYILGTLTVNGHSISDTHITDPNQPGDNPDGDRLPLGELLGYESDLLYEGDTLTLSYEVAIKDIVKPGWIIGNVASVVAFTDRETLLTASFSGETNRVEMQVSDVPEPSTVIILGTGLFGMLVLMRRRRKIEKGKSSMMRNTF